MKEHGFSLGSREENSKTFCSCRQSVKSLLHPSEWIDPIRNEDTFVGVCVEFVPEVTASLSMILTRALNRVGPRIDPCGRPVSVGCSLELNPWRATTIVLFVK
ncbi:hypothetical protein LSH36_1449g00024 [Paralvinella palmiformis]|uniref:Uncharacterized protein n=1 Tax=Paralvinella palmiformis TaxID=53620 RepID=A0AAD9MNZ1_9ANNE|nr:hypothetical protein LSH36_1449g00024 [Paralvinella palmiformis]